jgi:hypothetical protein
VGDNEIDIKEAQALAEGEKLGLLDRIVGRIISRKFFVFLTATALMIWSTLDPDTWGMIAMIYIGGQTVIDAAISWKHGKAS